MSKIINIYNSFLSVLSWINAKSLYIDGVNESGNIDSVIPSLENTSVGTWSFWIKPIDSTPAAQERFISFSRSSTSSTLVIGINASGICEIAHLENGAVKWFYRSIVKLLTDNVWSHLALVQDAVVPKVYKDGIAIVMIEAIVNDSTAWLNDITSIDNARIGSLNFTGAGDAGHFNGNVDEVLLINRALTQPQVDNIYNGGTPKDESGIANLIEGWRMGDDAGDNWNSGVANEWEFNGIKAGLKAFTVNCEEADVENDVPPT